MPRKGSRLFEPRHRLAAHADDAFQFFESIDACAHGTPPCPVSGWRLPALCRQPPVAFQRSRISQTEPVFAVPIDLLRMQRGGGPFFTTRRIISNVCRFNQIKLRDVSGHELSRGARGARRRDRDRTAARSVAEIRVRAIRVYGEGAPWILATTASSGQTVVRGPSLIPCRWTNFNPW